MSRPYGTLPEWASEATLGIFVHWGPYSVPAWAEPVGALGEVPDEEWFVHNAYAEWYANTIRLEGSPAARYHERVHGGRPYLELLDEWRAESYDPADWAALFAAVGADYVVPTTKHHDGVALWAAPTPGTPTTLDRGPGRDLITPLADAVRAVGLRFGVYYSGGLDWSFEPAGPVRSSAELERLRPRGAEYHELAYAHVVDLIDRFRPEVLWNDIDWPDAGKAPGPHGLDELFAHYRSVVPDGILNDRWGVGVWDFRTSEYAHDSVNETATGWEHCRGLGYSFGHNRVEDASLTLSPRELARLYADVVARGGRLLLNVGPTAAGEIPALQRRTLEGFAPWMRAVKPLTARREVLPPGALRASRGEVSGWRGAGGIVAVVDDPLVRVSSTSSERVRVVALPEE